MGTAVVLAAVVLIVILAVRSIYMDKKSGKSCAGCPGCGCKNSCESENSRTPVQSHGAAASCSCCGSVSESSTVPKGSAVSERK